MNGCNCHALVIMSLVSQQREFMALCNVPLLPQSYLSQILSPAAQPQSLLGMRESGLTPRLAEELTKKFNAAQQNAILSAVAESGPFSLIQVLNQRMLVCACFQDGQNRFGILCRAPLGQARLLSSSESYLVFCPQFLNLIDQGKELRMLRAANGRCRSKRRGSRPQPQLRYSVCQVTRS